MISRTQSETTGRTTVYMSNLPPSPLGERAFPLRYDTMFLPLPVQSLAGMVCMQNISSYSQIPNALPFNLVDIDIDIQIQRANDVVIHQRLVDCGDAAPGLAALQLLELGDMR